MTDHVLAQRLKLNESSTLELDDKRRASLVLAGHATDTAELLRWLDMLGLPPCERVLRSGPKWKGKR